jgi:DNA-binding transcriptional ArsR family regulator
MLRKNRCGEGRWSQHPRSLKQAGLIIDRPEGRNVHYRADPKGLASLVGWMALYAVFWRERLPILEQLIDP